MTEPNDPYKSRWNPLAYLRQYYAGPVSDDERAVAAFVSEQMNTWWGGNAFFPRGIEFGCGPTVHHAALLAPHVGELHLAEYLPQNLAVVRQWLDDRPGAFEWDAFLRGSIAPHRPDGVTAAELADRKARLRAVTTELKPGDLHQSHPLGDGSTYDLVGSFFVAECITGSRDEWQRNLTNLTSLVRPGGVFVSSALRRATSYRVLGETFAAACVDENDFAELLPRLGFDPATLDVRAVAVNDWVDEGFDGICLIWAHKHPGGENEPWPTPT